MSIRLAFADTILRFLNSLPEALVPASLHSKCVSATDRDDAFEVNSSLQSLRRTDLMYLKILDDLPPVSVNVRIKNFAASGCFPF